MRVTEQGFIRKMPEHHAMAGIPWYDSQSVLYHLRQYQQLIAMQLYLIIELIRLVILIFGMFFRC